MGFDVAVVVRANSTGNPEVQARQRIEQALETFELDSLLSRPRTIAWELTDPQESLADHDLNWLKRGPLVVVHSAASIRFQHDPNSGEPYRTNVQGTENLLALCGLLNVTAFHHVSTAYVGRHRQADLVYERLIDDDNAAGNDYERSKIAAERAVRACPHIGLATIHRPSIIVGDSQSAFTSTFHGFYTPLQIGWQYASLFGFSDEAGHWFRKQLGLSESDRKNIVTVDWVAEAIAQTLSRQSETERSTDEVRVFHWTHPQPVACNQIQAAIVDAIRRASSNKPARTKSNVTSVAASFSRSVDVEHPIAGVEPPSPEMFRDQMQAYESYFQNDADFDTTNSRAVSSSFACPGVDYELLSRLADWAIAAKFGWPKAKLPELPHQSAVRAIRLIPARGDYLGVGMPINAGTIVRLELLGPGAPESMLFTVQDSQWFSVDQVQEHHIHWRVSLANLSDCLSGRIPVQPLVSRGYWLIEGANDENRLPYAMSWLDQVRKAMQRLVPDLQT